MNGTDHMAPQPKLPGAIARYNAAAGEDVIIHGALPSYVDSVQQSLGSKALPTVRGELRNPMRFHLLPGVLSTRTCIKQRNHACQTLLEKWAEPSAAFAQLLEPSASALQALVGRSWGCLLQNHAHDSICGCSVDQVHREMMARFDWSERIAESVTDKSLKVITSSIETSTLAEDSASAIPIVVFNPAAGPRTDAVEVTAQLPGNLGEFVVQESTGEITPHQLVEDGQRSSLLFLAPNVPGHGWKTFFVTPIHIGQQGPSTSQSSIENEFYKVEVNAIDGTLVVTDKETGAVFRGLNRFVDGGDRGDEYNYCAPEEDTLVSNPDEAPTVQLVQEGPVRQTLEVRLVYRLPASLAEGRRGRSQETIEIPITSRISLYPRVRRIEIHTTVTNQARDHRLRVHFPTPWREESSFAESAFDVVERPIALPIDTVDWIEHPVATHPQATFVDLSDGYGGLMVANRGLPEYEAFHEGNSTTLALSLLRCVGWLSRDDLSCRRGHAGPELETPEAQYLGTHSFDYALIPHTGDWRTSFDEAHAFNAPLRAIVTNLRRGTLPVEGSFVEIGPSSLVISAIKSAEDGNGLILRFWNTEGLDVKVEVKLFKPFERVALVNLNEEELEELRSDGTRNVSVPVRGKEIVTLKLQFRS